MQCNDSTDLVRLYSDLVPYTMVLSKIYAIRVKTLSCMQLGNGCNCIRVANKVCGHEAYGGPTRCCLLSRCTILTCLYGCRLAVRLIECWRWVLDGPYMCVTNIVRQYREVAHRSWSHWQRPVFSMSGICLYRGHDFWTLHALSTCMSLVPMDGRTNRLPSDLATCLSANVG